MILEEEANYREISVKFGNVDNVLHSGECCDCYNNESLKVANGLFSTSRGTESAIDVSNSIMTSIDEYVDALEYIMDHTLKKPRRRKKCKNHYWSRKKIHTKVAHTMVVYNGPPEIIEIDNHISGDDIAHWNNVLRNEARKVLEVGKLLGLSFVDEDEVIINKLVELEGKD
ncbi:hypothetical protein COLO4_30165 [Corchorus olitorius]|uniref:Uncharacterized protein n=1 Tax=Corchorus olitorius TaxID=93759 RepID=A0A1R3HAQ7_9ROSI|nr:hypothetical protein COLO4_30165 [Corchorus olitorius]